MPVPAPEYARASLDQDARIDGRFATDATTPTAHGYDNASASVARALRLIEDGVLDHSSIDVLCERLGIGARQLRRLFTKHLGTSPIQVARIRRAKFARRLIETTGLSMAHVARAAGFGSVRRFNAVINEVYGCPPTALRRNPHRSAGRLELEIPVDGPFAWNQMLRLMAPWTVPGVEHVAGDRYYRTASFGRADGEICVTYHPEEAALGVRVSSSLGAHLLDVVSGVRRLFDVDAPMNAIHARLGGHPVLDKRIQASPGLRVPGAFDHFETAVMLVLSQHTHPAEGAERMRAVVEKHGKAIETSQPALTHIFPSPYVLSTARLEVSGVPKRRSRAVQTLAKAVHEGALRLDGAPSLDAALESLSSIADLSTITAHYMAMRVYREADAFPSDDFWLRRALSGDDTPLSIADLESRAARWRPWRAYAATHLWSSLLDGDSDTRWVLDEESILAEANHVA